MSTLLIVDTSRIDLPDSAELPPESPFMQSIVKHIEFVKKPLQRGMWAPTRADEPRDKIAILLVGKVEQKGFIFRGKVIDFIKPVVPGGFDEIGKHCLIDIFGQHRPEDLAHLPILTGYTEITVSLTDSTGHGAYFLTRFFQNMQGLFHRLIDLNDPTRPHLDFRTPSQINHYASPIPIHFIPKAPTEEPSPSK